MGLLGVEGEDAEGEVLVAGRVGRVRLRVAGDGSLDPDDDAEEIIVRVEVEGIGVKEKIITIKQA